jgi:predicted metalloprotease with PDZ domain
VSVSATRWFATAVEKRSLLVSGTIRYSISGLDCDAHEFEVTLRVPPPVAGGLRLCLPAWIPGSYMIRDFARNITSITASDEQGPVGLNKLDKQTWEVAECVGELLVEYRVYAFDLSVRSAYLDRTRAFLNGSSVFLSLPDRPATAWVLEVPVPNHQACADWRLATTLPVSEVDERGFGIYAGTGYDHLIDCPIEMGVHQRAEFSVDGVPHGFVVTDGGRFDMARLCRDLMPVCAEHAALFGKLPVDRYLFLTLGTADGYGGLEHRDSTSLICKRADLPPPGMAKVEKGYRQLLGLCSHEYFHLWNVKRIRPQRLAEADLSCEVHTELLWAFEGITSYYDELGLARAGVLSVEDYLDLLATTVTRVLRTPGRARQSIAASSFEAWTKFYQQDANAANAIVSYYTKGALVALGLDVVLRERSDDGVSLDDLMRLLWQRYGETGVGVPEDGIAQSTAELLGESLEGFFAAYVYGTEELPLELWFGKLGVGFRARPSGGVEDQGGYRVEPPADDPPPSLGVRLEDQPEGLRLTQVLAGGAAQFAGLSVGDLLVAVDGERASAKNIFDLLRRMQGAATEVHFFRRDRLMASMLDARPGPADTCDLWLLPDAGLDPLVRARRAAWLQSNRVLVA